MAAEQDPQDVFGRPLESLEPEADDAEEASETEAEPAETADEALPTQGDVPTDPQDARRYWQAAYTKSRQKDRERYGTLENEHGQYRDVLARFYRDDEYARQVLAQRFPQLAQQMGQGQQGGQTPTGAAAGQGLTQQLQQSLGEFGFLASALGPVLERVIQDQVNQRVGPLESRTVAQSEQARRRDEDRLLAEMDAQHPGWEESFGTQMQELDEFLASEHLTHPVFGNKYELYYRLLNRGASRVEASREMGRAARQRTSLTRNGQRSVPNVADQVRTAESARAAFQLAARAALGAEGRAP